MYQALYRKYRPANFDDVVGQDVIVRTLKNAIINNNITHAYLFSGPRGTGKTSVAKILAKTVNCQNNSNGTPCEKCVVCTQINNKNFVDIIEIDAASNNGVDEIRELRNKINLVPSLGKYKVYIIDEVHMLTTGAFNALLKTLEEPPKHAIFILATTEPQKIPPTILSRCQRFDFKKISDKSIFFRVKQICEIEKINIGDEEINEIARLSDGGMRDALSLLDQVSSYSDDEITFEDIHAINGTITKKEMLELTNFIADNDLYNILRLIDKWCNDGKNLSKIIEELMLFLKNLLIYLEIPKYFDNDNEVIKNYNDITKNISYSKIITYIEMFNNDLYKIKKSSNPKLMVELLFIKMLNFDKNIDKKQLETEKEIVKNTQNVVKKVEKSNNNIIDKEFKREIENLKNIRINNTLATFDKKILLKLKSLQDDIKPLLIDLDYSKYASIILDGQLKAASKENLIYVYETEENSDLFNENILDIERTLEKVFAEKYKVISTDIISWEIIKNEFNRKSKKYFLMDEPVEIEKIFAKREEQNEIENLFDNKIIYN